MRKTRRLFDKLFGRKTSNRMGAMDAKVRKTRRTPAELARDAGFGANAGLEQLEQRQMLFVLAVNRSDPTFVDLGNNQGTVTANFGYFIPFLSAIIPGYQAPTALTENFDLPNVPPGALNPFTNNTLLRAFFPGAANPFTVALVPGGAAGATAQRLVANIPGQVGAVPGTGGLSFMNPANTNQPRTLVGATWTSDVGALPAGITVQVADVNAAGVLINIRNVVPIVVQTQPGPPPAFLYTIPTDPNGFQRIIFNNANAGATVFNMDDFTGLIPSARFNAYLNARLFGAQITLFGTIDSAAAGAPLNNDGTAIDLVDLYGRQLTQTIALSAPAGSTIMNADLNADGVPDFNDGIGRINIIRGSGASSFSIQGGTIELAQQGTIYDFQQGGFGFRIARDANLYAAFLAGGFGLAFDGPTQSVIGAPGGAGSVIIGSPWTRDNRNAVLYFGGSFQQAPALQGTDTQDQTTGAAVQLRPDNFNLTNPIRVFGAQNRAAGSATSNFARYAYANPNNFHGIVDTLIENNLGVSLLPSFQTTPNLPNPIVANPPPAATGLPPNPAGPALITGIGFQANVAPNFRSWGQIFLDGLTFGAITFDNASLGRLVLGNNMANVVIDGDLGTLVITGHMGGFFDPRSQAPTDAFFISPMTITVGRTLGQAIIAGRSLRPITVLGDVNNPNRPQINFLNYAELEGIPAFNPNNDNPGTIRNAFSGNLTGSGPIFFGGSTDAATGIFRNDDLTGAEWIGNAPTVRVSGTLNGANPLHSEDPSDTFSFAATAGRTITVNVAFQTNPPPPSQDRVYARIVDRSGRTVATHPFPFLSPNYLLPGNNYSPSFSFTADTTGVYYLVIGTLVDGNNTSTIGYTATVSGQTALTVGQINYAGGSIVRTNPNAPDFNGRQSPITVQNGSVGLIAIGNGYLDSAGVNTPHTGLFGTVEPEADYRSTDDFVLSVGGDVYALIFGGDLRAATINIGGNLGQLITGARLNNATTGMMSGVSLSVGGTISQILVSGTIGYQVNGTPEAAGGPGAMTTIRSGQNGTPGHIGQIRVGNFINGQQLTLVTSANSIIDSFVVGGGPGAAGQDNGRILLGRPIFNLGAGSDIRFLSFAALSNAGPGSAVNEDQLLIIQYNIPLQLTDDSGAEYTIIVSGGTVGAGGTNLTGATVGTISLLPVTGQFGGGAGAALGRMTVNLNGGATLTVLNNSAFGKLSLGNIVINSATPGTPVSIAIMGSGETDVFLISSTANVANIRNATTNGDLLNIDVPALLNLLIDNGSLGYTEISGPISARELTPRRGLALGASGAVGGPLGIIGGGNSPLQNGTPATVPFVPTNWRDTNDVGLEDIGSPVSDNMNGLIVRTGNLGNVSVANRLGNIIMQGDNSIISNIVANPLARGGDGVFRGISGVIYAANILSVDIGDGVAGPGDTPFAQAGIFANNDIGRIFGGQRVLNPVIRGVIIAADNITTLVQGGTFLHGIGSIELFSGRFDGAFIGAASIDAWWRSSRVGGVAGTTIGDPPQGRGTIHQVIASNASIVRTSFFASAINTIRVTGGAWDASTADVQGPVGGGNTRGFINSIQADRFINSTLDGEPREFRFNAIRASGDVGQILATGLTPDIIDLTVTVGGNLTAIQARNILRGNITVAGRVTQIYALGDIRATDFNIGSLSSLYVAGSMINSTLLASGSLAALYVVGDMNNVSISTTGGGGGVGYMYARSFSGTLTSSGTVGTIYVTGGDFTGSITTTNLTGPADLTFLYSSRDLNISLNIAGNVTTIYAGRNVGRRLIDGATNTATTPDVIDIRGNLSSITAGGQLYADVRVGQSILGLIYTGYAAPVFAIPGNAGSDAASDASITAFGRIAGVYWFGDFAGRVTSHSGGLGYMYLVNGSIRNLGVDGSGNRINSIDVRDGDLGVLYIISGHLLGNINVRDGSIGTLYVTGDATVFGNIGIDPNLALGSAAGVLASQFRNQLPPGTTNPGAVNGNGVQDGPMIFAGRDITYIYSTGGIFETGIQAGRNIGTISSGRGFDVNPTPNTPTGTTTASFIVAGNNISYVGSTRMANGLFIGAGISNLGADNRAGGVGLNADTVRQGNITTTIFSAGTNNVVLAAGMNAGADGLYSLGADDTAAAGLSTIGTVNVVGAVSVRAWADTSIGFATAGVVRGGGSFVGSAYTPAATSDLRILAGPAVAPPGFVALAQGIATAFVTGAGETGTITFVGTGQAFFNAATMGVVLAGTTAGSSLTVNNTGAFTTVSGLFIQGYNDASLGSLTINSTLQGNSGIFVDGTVSSFRATNINITANATFGTGVIGFGSGTTSFTTGNFTQGILQTGGSNNTIAGLLGDGDLGTVSITGAFGTGAAVGGRVIRTLTASTITIGGAAGGVISVERDLSSLRVTGVVTNGNYRVGGTLTSFSAGGATNLLLGAGGGIGSASFSGATTDTTVAAGLDLGTDAVFGGVGLAADKTRASSVGSVNVFGNFTRSNVIAGINRGTDGFFGTNDDISSDGRANIGSVTISGTATGSGVGSESYRVLGTGTVGALTIGGFSSNGGGNFQRAVVATQPTPIQVTDLRVTQNANTYTARITFNQQVNAASILGALTIAEVRGTAAAQVVLAPLVGGTVFAAGIDYVVAYDANTRTATVTFSQAVTSRNLATNVAGPDGLPGLSGPGVFRFTLASTGANRLQGITNAAALDGNSDGTTGDNFVRADIVGDAGDRLGSFTGAAADTSLISLYPPVNIDNILNSQTAPSLLPTTNRAVTIRGFMGDHPDSNTNGFQVGSDVDMYSVTLAVGQILRLGAMQGTARAASITILNTATGITVTPAQLQLLQGAIAAGGADTNAQNFLCLVGGNYTIMVSTNPLPFQAPSAFAPPPPPLVPITTQRDIVNLATNPGVQGDYSFTVTVSDDGDSGFRQAALPAVAPVGGPATVAAFNATRTNTVTVAGTTAGTQYIYRYIIGPDGVLDSADDRIVGTLSMSATGVSLGVVSSRSAGLDNILGTGDDVIELTNDSSDGSDIVPAPLPSAFLNGAPNFNNPNNLPFINVGAYTFRLDPGANGVFNGNGTAGAPSDDVVIGTDGNGHTIERRAGTSGVFSDAVGNTNTITVRSTIGESGQVGNPNNIMTDVDVYQLNNGLPIAPGTRYRITLRANADGGNFGRLFPQPVTFQNIQGFQITDLRGLVQFGIFDSSVSTTQAAANVFAAPNNVRYFGNGTPNTNIANNNITRYGYDASGDFFIEFAAAPQLNLAAPNGANNNTWARLSLYIQGAVRANYSVEVQQLASAVPPVANTNPMTQNVLIALQGGTINWLETGSNRSTTLAGYNPADNGYANLVNNVSALTYMTTTNAAVNPTSLILQLQAMFNAITGFTPGGNPLVNFSTDASTFAGQPYSTIFLTSSLEPTAFFNNGQFGAVERTDTLNANNTDQGVVFMPSLNALGTAPTQAGLDSFIRQLTVVVGRQVGQLLGVRVQANQGAVPLPGPYDTTANNTFDLGGPTNFRYSTTGNNLAPVGSVNSGTQFLLGQQTSQNLLQRIFNAQ